MANVPISKIQVPGSEDTLLLRDSTAANKVQSATNDNLAALDENGNLKDGGWSSLKTTTSATGNPISISGLKANQLAIDPIITLEPIQAGSGTPSPSNIRAISGYDKIEVLSCGKNLFNPATAEDGYRINASGEKISSTSASLSDYISVTPNTSYYITEVFAPNVTGSGGYYDANKNFIGIFYAGSTSTATFGTVTTPANCYYVRLNIILENKATAMICLDSEGTSYESYHKATSISESLWPTVYGGSLDVRTGKFSVTYKMIDLGDLNYNYEDNNSRFVTTTSLNDIGGDTYGEGYYFANVICERYANSVSGTSGTFLAFNINTSPYNKKLLIYDTAYTDATAFKTAMSGVKLVYELATPITIQLTPHEISLLKDYAYVSTNGTLISLSYHNGEIASLTDVSQVAETVNELGANVGKLALPNTAIATDKSVFLNRQCLNPTGFTGYVREKLIGASYAWNQLVQNGNFASVSDWSTNGISQYSVSGNIATFTASTKTYGIYQVIPAVAGHKYLWSCEYKATNDILLGSINLSGGRERYSASANSFVKVIHIEALNSGASTLPFYIYTADNVETTIQIKNVYIIDLTVTFGTEIADYLYGLSNNGGIKKLRDMGCPIDQYTPYGNYLVSSKASGKKIVGFNLISGYEKGGIESSDGSDNSNANACRIKYVTVIPNITYYFIQDSNYLCSIYVFWYDGDKKLISTREFSNQEIQINAPINAHYFRCSLYRANSGWGTTLPNRKDNFNISDPSKNGTYEPYSGYEISLGNDELRGIFKLVDGEIVADGDVKESNGEITRKYDIVDLGSLDWALVSADSHRFRTGATGMKVVPDNNTVFNGICSKYVSRDANTAITVDKSISLSTSPYLIIKDDNYSDATVFKNSLSGVYFIYELATPTTEQSTPFADPMSLIGATTEEYIDDRTIPCPVGAVREYMGESEDRIEFPSSPGSDGKRVLTSYKSGDEEKLVWEPQHLYHKEWVAVGDGTTTWGDLLAQLKPYYESLTEEEKMYSKLIMWSDSIDHNHCLSYTGAYWYGRATIMSQYYNFTQAELDTCKYITCSGSNATYHDYTNDTTSYSVTLRVVSVV